MQINTEWKRVHEGGIPYHYAMRLSSVLANRSGIQTLVKILPGGKGQVFYRSTTIQTSPNELSGNLDNILISVQ